MTDRMPDQREMYLLMDLTKLYADIIGPPTVEPREFTDFELFLGACLETAGVDIYAKRAAWVMVKMFDSDAFDDYEYQFLLETQVSAAAMMARRHPSTTIH